MSHQLDEYDRAILSALQGNGRLSNLELAEKINLSPSACHKRFRRLERDGIITGYSAILNPDALGQGQSVFVQVTLEQQDSRSIERFEKAITDVPEVAECYLMSGMYDYLVLVMVRDSSDYERLHRQVLTNLPGVSRISSHFSIRAVSRRSYSVGASED